MQSIQQCLFKELFNKEAVSQSVVFKGVLSLSTETAASLLARAHEIKRCPKLSFTKRHLVEHNKVHHRKVLLNSFHSGVICFGILSAKSNETKRNLRLTWILINEINNKIKCKSELPSNFMKDGN